MTSDITLADPSVDLGLSPHPAIAESAAAIGVSSGCLEQRDIGQLPFVAHNSLHGQAVLSIDGFLTVPIDVAGHRFYLLSSSTDGKAFDALRLRGHRLAADDDRSAALVREGLEIVARRADCFSLLRKTLSTFAVVEWMQNADGEPMITSCSLPDVPFCAFLSDRAAVHVPPLTLAAEPSARFVAENLFHEAVHQAVKLKLLCHRLLPPDYDAATSPRVPIYWRSGSISRNREWELERVLHAAAVYVHLIDWRTRELTEGDLSSDERRVVLESGDAAVKSLRHLLDALHEHVDHFTARGGLFIGKLSEAASRHVEALLLLQDQRLIAARKPQRAGT